MEKTNMKTFELCELKDSLMQWAREHKDNSSIQQMGEVVDMIKDLAEAEEKCWKACYYKSIVEAMDEEKRYGGDRAGYDHWRYSSGRYAPKGRGHYSAGYTPVYDDMDMGKTDWDFMNPRMGYTTSGKSNTSGRGGASSSSYHGYDRYRTARMGYHESGSPDDKREMNDAAKEHMEEMAESMRDILQDADPSLKKELKSSLMSLIGEMS